MQIPKKILKECVKQVSNYGITVFANKAGLDYRTVKKITETGECTYAVFEKLSAFLINDKKAIKKLENQLN